VERSGDTSPLIGPWTVTKCRLGPASAPLSMPVEEKLAASRHAASGHVNINSSCTSSAPASRANSTASARSRLLTI